MRFNIGVSSPLDLVVQIDSGFSGVFFAGLSTKSSLIMMGSPLNGGAGLAGKSGRKTANACGTNVREMSVNTTAHLIFAAKNTFTEVPIFFITLISFSR
jgi:hypothetical protein